MKHSAPIATIYGDCLSRHAYKLLLLRSMLGLNIEWQFSDIGEGSTRSERIAAGNPMGQVPTVILADGRALPESNAAMVFFAKGSNLWPTDDYDQAQVLRWMMFEQNQVDPALAVSLSLNKATYEVENREIILAYLKPKVERLLAAVEAHLADNDWFVGDQASIADLVMYAYLHEAESAGFAISQRYRDWLARVEAMPGFVSIQDAMAAERA